MPEAPVPARKLVRGIVPKMIELSEQIICGDIWERPGLSKRDRSLIVVASLISQYRPEQLRGHLARALDNGVTKDEIAEMDHSSGVLLGLAGIHDGCEHRAGGFRGARPGLIAGQTYSTEAVRRHDFLSFG
jgi:4-carboxymuconolactone decarboxylase